MKKYKREAAHISTPIPYGMHSRNAVPAGALHPAYCPPRLPAKGERADWAFASA